MNSDYVCTKSEVCRQKGWHSGCSHAKPHDKNADCFMMEDDSSCPDCVHLSNVVVVNDEQENALMDKP